MRKFSSAAMAHYQPIKILFLTFYATAFPRSASNALINYPRRTGKYVYKSDIRSFRHSTIDMVSYYGDYLHNNDNMLHIERKRSRY